MNTRTLCSSYAYIYINGVLTSALKLHMFMHTPTLMFAYACVLL